MKFIPKTDAKNLAFATMAILLVVFASISVHAGSKTYTGSFKGDNGHVTTGNVTIKKEGGSMVVVLENNFSLDGAPAPTLGFSKGGKFDKATEFSALKSNTGRQVFKFVVPGNIN